jgi:hypothetical protein
MINKKILITESQLKRLISESYYDSNKLYSKQYIENVTRNASREIKNIVNSLEIVGCVDVSGNLSQCVRIPEVLFVYVSGRY